MALLKKKEPYVPKTGLLEDAVDYNLYTLHPLEFILSLVVGAAAGFAVGWVFYESLVLSILLAAVCAFFAPRLWRKRQIKKRKDKLLLQFREMLDSLFTSLGAGSNVYEAFQSAESDMSTRFGEEAMIVDELKMVNNGIVHNYREEDMLLNFGERSGLEDVISFAEVFETCNRKGGDIREVIRSTRGILSDKIEVAQDIKTAVTSQTTEQNAMLVMPVVMVFLLKQMGSDMVNLTSPVGRIATTIALILFAVAYFMSRKILDIKA
jgi:tight adherence protein B